MTRSLEIIGRQSSHYTRLTRIFAAELGLEYAFTPVYDLTSRNAADYAGNPALKLPILKLDGAPVYGSLNICRSLHRCTGGGLPVYWPEHADTPLLMNAHEILAHAMAAQVEVVLHEIVAQRPADRASLKRRQSLVDCLAWLDGHLTVIRNALPGNGLSFFEVSLFCLTSHLPFRNPGVDITGMQQLLDFQHAFGTRASAQATPYRFDRPATPDSP